MQQVKKIIKDGKMILLVSMIGQSSKDLELKQKCCSVGISAYHISVLAYYAKIFGETEQSQRKYDVCMTNPRAFIH